MKRKLWKALLVAGLLLGGLAAAGGLYVSSRGFQEKLRLYVVDKVQEATGQVCSIGSFHFDPFRLSFQVAGLQLTPAAGEQNRFGLAVERIEGRLTLKALLLPHVELAELAVTGPRISFRTGDSEDGWKAESFLRVLRRSFDFASGRAEVRGGWVEWNQVRIPLEFSLEDLACAIRYREEPLAYGIDLSYRNGRVAWGDREIPYDLQARLDLSIEGIEIESFHVRRGMSHFLGTGSMKDWRSPALVVQARGKMTEESLPLFHSSLSEARGDLEVAGTLRWDRAGFWSAGRFSTPAAGYRKVGIAALRGDYQIKDDTIFLAGVEGRIGEGRITCEGHMHLKRDPLTPHDLTFTTRAVRIRDLTAIINLDGFDLANAVNAAARVSWRTGASDLKVEADADLLPPVAQAAAAGRWTPLAGTLGFGYRQGAWHLPKADLRSADTVFHAEGRGWGRSRIRLRTKDPSEVLEIVGDFSRTLKDLAVERPERFDLAGEFGLEGELRLDAPEGVSYEGHIESNQGRWSTFKTDRLAAGIFWDGSRLRLRAATVRADALAIAGDLELEVPPPGESLKDWKFSGSVANLSLAWLRDAGVTAVGDATGLIEAEGVAGQEDGKWLGDTRFQIVQGVYRDLAFDLARGRARVQQGRLNIMGGRISSGSAQLEVDGFLELDTGGLELSARATSFPLADIPAIQRNEMPIRGQATASGTVAGTLDNPRAEGSFELKNLQYSDWNLGSGKGTFEFGGRSLAAKAAVASELGRLQGRVQVSTGEDYSGSAVVEFGDWNIQKMLEGKVPEYFSEVSTALQGRVEIRGNFDQPAKLGARGEMDGARFRIGGVELQNRGKIGFSVANRRLYVSQAQLSGEATDLALDGIIPLDDGPGLELALKGQLNLRILDHLATKVGIVGSADLDVRASGSLGDPQVIGQASFRDVRLGFGDFPYPLTALQGKVIFSRNSVGLENVRGNFASGSVTVTGSLEHQNAELRALNLQAEVKRARLLYPRDFRSTVDGRLNLRGSGDAQLLTGEVKVVRAEYQRDFNLLEQLAARSAAPAGPGVTDPFLAGIRLNVSIHSEDGLSIDNELTKLRGRINLTLRGTVAYPSLTGRVEVTEGFIFFRGNRFEIIRGAADFVDRNRINPTFDLRAEADVKTYRLMLDATGDLGNLRFNMASDPPLSTVDIVALMTTGISGRGDSTQARAQSEITGLSAASILSESLSGVLGKRVQRIFGLESFRVDPFLAGAENDPTARVTITERLSKDLAVTFSRNLSTNEEQIVVVEYDVTRNLSIVATRDEEGAFGIDFRFRKRFR